MEHPSGSAAFEPRAAMEQGHNGETSVVPTMNVLVGTTCKNKLLYEKILLPEWASIKEVVTSLYIQDSALDPEQEQACLW